MEDIGYFCHGCGKGLTRAEVTEENGELACCLCHGTFVEAVESPSMLQVAEEFSAGTTAGLESDVEQEGNATGGHINVGNDLAARILTQLSEMAGLQTPPASGVQPPQFPGVERVGAGPMRGVFIPLGPFPLPEGDGRVLSVVQGMMQQAFGIQNLGDYVFGEDGYNAVIAQSLNAPSQLPPAAPEAIDALPVLELDEKTASGECPVCRDSFEAGKQVMRMPCGHIFCTDCLRPWLQARNTCPTCRFELRTNDPEYERRRAMQQATGATAPAQPESSDSP